MAGASPALDLRVRVPAIILLVLWALGFFAFHVASGLIHILLVIGIIVLIWNFVTGRRAV